MVSWSIRSDRDQELGIAAEDDGRSPMNFSSACVKLQFRPQVLLGSGVEGVGIRASGMTERTPSAPKQLQDKETVKMS